MAGAHASHADLAVTRWAAIHDAAEAVRAIAGQPPKLPGQPAHEFPVWMAGAEAERREQAEKGLGDIAAMMEVGLMALLTVNARGSDPRPAAEALWHEFSRAREGIIALLPNRE